MKKFFLLYLLALPFLFIGCDDDEETPDSLTGTTWTYSGSEIEDGNKITYTLGITFKNATTCEYFIQVPGEEDYSYEQEYTYTKPNVRIVDEEGEVITGTVNGNKMTLTYEGGESVVLKKK